MLKSRFVVLMLVLLLAIPLFGAQAQDGTIIDVATQAGNFTTLLAAVEAAGLTDVLSGEGPYTVFAPSDEAFAALPAPVLDYLVANPEVLTRVLTYHVVSGSAMSADIAGMTDENGMAMADSMEMSAVGAEPMGSQLTVTVAEDGSVMVNDANVVTADVAASNGVIHVIDRVLVPDLSDLMPEIDPLSVEGDIIASGSSTVFPLSEAIAAQFSDEGFTGNISIDNIGTGGGFERFCVNAEADIANASRPIKTEEADACAALETPRIPIPFRVGLDALTVVVSSENDFVNDLTTEQLALAFSTAETWADVDPSFPAEPILRYIPGTDSGTFDYFVEVIYAKDEAPILAAANLSQSEDDNVLVQGVESSPYAIGFFGYAYYQAEASNLRALSINGITPSAETAEDGTYSLARPLFLYSDPTIMAEKPQVAAFIGYYIQVVNDVIGEVGYFPVSQYAMNRTVLWWLATSGM